MIRIIGIDPGTIKLGLSILSLENKKIEYINSYQIYLKGKSLEERMFSQGEQIEKIIKECLPLHSIALEETFISSDKIENSKGETTFKYSKDSPLMLSVSRGVVYYIAGKYGIPVFEYNNQKCKKYLTGVSTATKTMVMRACQQKWGKKFEEDESCSLAVGHAHLLTLAQTL